MATIFKEEDRAAAWADSYPPIAYSAIASDLFHSGEQRLVPFLGSGSSLHSQDSHTKKTAPSRLDTETVNSLCDQLHLSGTARDLLLISAALAVQLQSRSASTGATSINDPVSRLSTSEDAPSASELAEALCHRVNLDTIMPLARKLASLELGVSDLPSLASIVRAVISETGIGTASASLLPAASYFEYVAERVALWELLQKVFETKRQSTPTHHMIARAAGNFLSIGPPDDYLIVTTNYDRLMEVALEAANVPYYALTVQRTEGPLEGKVAVRLSENLQTYFANDSKFRHFKQKSEEQKTTENFYLKAPKPIVCLHKIHGCLFPPAEAQDSIIITDEDYVWYINRDAREGGMMPAIVRTLLEQKGLLFLGYSFSDWNVRSHFKSMLKARAGQKKLKDYAVIREVNPYESAFFRTRDISILETTLDRFAERVTAAGEALGVLTRGAA